MEQVIRVTGKGQMSVAPDLISLTLEGKEVFEEYEKAVEKSAEATGIVKEAVKNAGLDPKDLKTLRFSIDTEYDMYRDKDGVFQKKFVGYSYSLVLNIKFPNDNKQLGKVLYSISTCNEAMGLSINYTVKDTDGVKNELLRKAVEDSRIKAGVLARAAGASIGEIKTIDYSWKEIELLSDTSFRRNLECVEYLSSDDSRSSYNIDIEADDINIEDTVTIVWEIKGQEEI